MDKSPEERADEERIEVMRLMLQEGSELLGRMNDRVDILRSRNVDFLALVLTVVSLVVGFLLYAADQKWIPLEHLVLSLLFFVPTLRALHLCYGLIKPRKYPELATYENPDFEIVLGASLERALSNLIYWRRDVLRDLETRYFSEMPIHKKSIRWFVASLFGLLAFVLIELIIA